MWKYFYESGGSTMKITVLDKNETELRIQLQIYIIKSKKPTFRKQF